MKKLFSSIAAVFLFSQLVFSQFETFDLSKYKLPEIKRKQLDLNFDFSESSTNTKIDGEISESSETYSNLNGLTNLRYVSYVNKSNYQGNQNYSIRFSPEFTKHKLNEGFRRDRELNTGISITSENRFYFGDQYFFEADVISYANMTTLRITDDAESRIANSEYSSYFVAIPISIGKGRIEPIQDARLAVYIFEELQKQGRLTRIPSEEEIIEFSQLISQLKNERYFDYRLKRIAEIEQVDEFLQAKALVTQADASYFTTVYDNWEYSAGPVRQSGTRVSVGLNPGVSGNTNYIRDENNDPPALYKQKLRNTDRQISFRAAFTQETPLNLHWQRSIGISAYYQLNDRKMNNLIDETESNFKEKLLSFRTHYDLEYYPNSRTSFGTVVSLVTRYEMTDHQNDYDEKELEFLPGLGFFMIYYISPQLRLNVDFSADYYLNDSRRRYYPETDYIKGSTKRFQQGLRVSFAYSIF